MISNKRAVIGTALTWVAAMIIIFFILLMYFIGVTASTSGGIGRREVNVVNSYDSLSVTQSLIGFLEKEIEYNGGNILVKDLLIGEDEDKFKRFEDESKIYLEEEYSQTFRGDRSLWLRVYDVDAFVDPEDYKVKFYLYVGNFPFSSLKSKFNLHYGPCLPDDSNSLIVDMFVIPDKKIIMCIPNEK